MRPKMDIKGQPFLFTKETQQSQQTHQQQMEEYQVQRDVVKFHRFKVT